MRHLVYVFLAIAGCGCTADRTVPRFEQQTLLPNVTIGELREYLSDAELIITDDVVIAGRVVSSTRAGNFYNTFLLDDGTGAVEVMAGWPDLDALFRPGQRVAVRARGLAVGWRDGVMQLGLPPDAPSRYSTGYFYHPTVLARWVVAERDVVPVAPIETTIGALRRELCGRLVRLSGLTVDMGSESTTWASVLPDPTTGYVKFRSSRASLDGAPPADSIIVVTSGYASFALAPVPSGRGTLTGILLWGRGGGGREHYLLKLRDEEDIDF